MFVRFSLPVMVMVLMTIGHIGAAADPTSALLEKLRQIQVRTPRRQSSGNGSIPISEFPLQCQKGCTTAVNALNTCSAATCLCNAAVDSSLQECVNCSVNAQPTPTVIQNGQQALDSYNTLCKGTGVSSLSLSISSTSGSGASRSVAATTGQSSSGLSGPKLTITVLPSSSTPAGSPAQTSSTSNLPSAAIGALPSFSFASIGLAITLLIPLLA